MRATFIGDTEAAFGIKPLGSMTLTSQDPAAAPKSRVQVIFVDVAVID